MTCTFFKKTKNDEE